MTARQFVAEAIEGALDLLYPPKCLLCKTLRRPPLCDRCRASFALLGDLICARCGTVIEQRRGRSRDVTPFCYHCEHQPGYSFSIARAAGLFDGRLREAILLLKFQGRRALGPPLGQWLADAVGNWVILPHPVDVLVPVPLHRSRLRERGFNQSALLAWVVGEKHRWPVDEAILDRVRRTRPQVGLSAPEREENVKGAFALRPGADVAGKRVVLVDDVVTTLSTVNECARVLRAAGAREVTVLSLARGS